MVCNRLNVLAYVVSPTVVDFQVYTMWALLSILFQQ